MKKYGKLLALMLAFVMAASMFTACGEEQAQQQGQQHENDPTEDIKKVVEAYTDAGRSYDLEEAMKYVDEDSDLYEDLEKINDGDLYTETGEKIAKSFSIDESYAEKIGKLYENFYKAVVKKQETKVDEVKVSDDKKTAEVICSGKTLDEDFINEAFSDATFVEIGNEMYGDQKFSEDKLDAVRFSVVEEMFARAEDDIKLEEVEKTVEMELIDGEWKITNIED